MSKQNALTEPVYYILLSLLTPMHGYGIMQNVKKLTNDRVNIGAGTLYGAINTLLSKGFIAEYKSDPSKKEYILTEKSGHRNGTYIARDEAYRSIALKGNYKPGTWLNVQIEKAETFALLAKEVL